VELRDHLNDSIAEDLARGIDKSEAQQRAAQKIGTADELTEWVIEASWGLKMIRFFRTRISVMPRNGGSLWRTGAATLLMVASVLAIPSGVFISASIEAMPRYVVLAGIGIVLSAFLWSIKAAAWFSAAFTTSLVLLFPHSCSFSGARGFFGCSSLLGIPLPSYFALTESGPDHAVRVPDGSIQLGAALMAAVVVLIVVRRSPRDPIWRLRRPDSE
jgi:hypothetical protein